MTENTVKNYYNKQQGYGQKFPLSFMKRVEKDAVISLFKNIKGKDALDIGAGSGFYAKILLEWGAAKVFAVDVSAEMLKQLHKQNNIVPVHSAIESLMLGRKFDVLLSCGMMEFLQSPLKAFEVIRSHANDDAGFYLLVPSKGFMGMLYKIFHKMHGINVKLFSVKDVEKLARQTSWRVDAKTKRLFGFVLILRLAAI